MSTAYIPCKVFRGLFETEYYVTVNSSSAHYVNASSVRVRSAPEGQASVDGKVLAYVVERRNGKTLVQLSGEAALGGLRTWVDSHAVSVA